MLMFTFGVWSSWCSVLEVFSRLNILSAKAIRSWKIASWGSSLWNNLMMRFQRSCKTMTIHKGNCVCYSQASILQFQKELITEVFEALLLTKWNMYMLTKVVITFLIIITFFNNCLIFRLKYTNVDLTSLMFTL